ncbi:MAG: STAS domain-containing protein [Actinobacteria bacterium]|nr:STAS domain-containing protein [Actinomycetota bacterium]
MENWDEKADHFDVVVDRRSDSVVVGLTGDLDLAAAQAVTGFVAGELRHLDRDVIFDLADLDFIDMAGARLLAVAVAAVTRSGFACKAVSAAPLAARVIEFSGLADVLGAPPSGTVPTQAGDVVGRTTAATGRLLCARQDRSVNTRSRCPMMLQAAPRGGRQAYSASKISRAPEANR